MWKNASGTNACHCCTMITPSINAQAYLAATVATFSIQAMICPPNVFPWWLACGGRTSSMLSTRVSSVDTTGALGFLLHSPEMPTDFDQQQQLFGWTCTLTRDWNFWSHCQVLVVADLVESRICPLADSVEGFLPLETECVWEVILISNVAPVVLL